MSKILDNKIKICTNRIINSELFIILTGIMLFLKATMFYSQTIYLTEPINAELVAKTFIISMQIVVILFLFKNRARFVLGLFMNFVISSIMFADNLYYNYSTSLISVSQISNLKYSEQISTAMTELFSMMDLFYFIDIISILL